MSPISRRAFLKSAAQAGLFCAVPSLAGAAALSSGDTVCISIFHTTDLHGHILPTSDYHGVNDLGGFARCAAQIRKWRRQNRNSILIDVGDVYQGTEVGLRSKGELMIDLFNHLKYDAWIAGNHEFDWGIETFANACARSTMPVLAANAVIEGKVAGDISDSRNPFSGIQPAIVKEIAGIKIAVIGVTTPGMPFWHRPEFLGGIEFQHPAGPVRRAIAKAKSDGADAIVLAGHMGLKARTGGDDFANSVMALTSEFPNVAAFIAGHTHQPIPSRLTNGVLLTQADHFGIHLGRVDLFFDRNSKRLLDRQATCALMDKQVRLDRVVLSRAKPALDQAEIALNQPIGELADTLHVRAQPGEPSDVEKLIGAAMMEALQQQGVAVDGALHGLFDQKSDLPPGPKTVGDVWNILPYENYIVTAALTPEQIKMALEEIYVSHETRSLLGLRVLTEGRGYDRRVVSITRDDGQPLVRDQRYVIALNSFDSRSAGHRFMKLRAFVEAPEANCRLHQVQTRDALIEYFQRHQMVRRIARGPVFGLAA